MQLTIRHYADHLKMPVSYHQILQGVVYNNISYLLSYSTYMHDKGYKYNTRSYKPFVFSEISGKYHIENGFIIFNGMIEWEVRSADLFLMHVLKESLEVNGIDYGKVHINDIELIVSNRTVEDTILQIEMKTPIIVYSTDEETKEITYYDPSQLEFYAAVNANVKRKYIALYDEEPEDIVFNPIEVNEKDRHHTRYKNYSLEGWTGTYLLAGERKVLDFLYQTGLGSRNAQGYGMFEITGIYEKTEE